MDRIARMTITACCVWMGISFTAFAANPYPINHEINKLTYELLAQSEAIKSPYPFEFLGREFIALPGMYSPKLDLGTFLAKKFPFRKGSFLELGAGAGAFAVTAALRGATKVVATNVNPQAVKNVRINSILHEVESVVQVRVGKTFQPIDKEEKFDTIWWNIPIGNIEKEDLNNYEQAVFDPGYKLMREYLCTSLEYTAPNGRVYFSYSTEIGDFNIVKTIAKECNRKVIPLYAVREQDRVLVELVEVKPL